MFSSDNSSKRLHLRCCGFEVLRSSQEMVGHVLVPLDLLREYRGQCVQVNIFFRRCITVRLARVLAQPEAPA